MEGSQEKNFETLCPRDKKSLICLPKRKGGGLILAAMLVIPLQEHYECMSIRERTNASSHMIKVAFEVRMIVLDLLGLMWLILRNKNVLKKSRGKE